MKRASYISIPVLFVVLVFPFFAFAQGKAAITPADSLFLKRQYAKALPQYLEQQKQSTLSDEQTFRMAACMVEASPSRQLQAADILTRISELPNAPVDVWFYLGEANRHLYRFEKAIEHFNTFLSKAVNDNSLIEPAELYISSCENGLTLLGFAGKLSASGEKTVPLKDFYSIYDTFSAGYPAVKPKSMKMAVDTIEKKGYDDVVFFPEQGSARNAGVIYFPSYGEDGTSGLDIYCIRKLNDSTWSEPITLGAPINTPFDEDFPYITPDGKTLYFASKGHYGMGGYDIYRSEYNLTLRTWSTPENLGFPISSPYDDFFFVPDAANRYACFATNRSAEGDSVTVYKIELGVNPDAIELSDENEIFRMAAFDAEPSIAAPTPNVQPVSVPIKALSDNEDYLTLLKGAKLFSDKLLAQQQLLNGLRQRLQAASPQEQDTLAQQITTGEQEMEHLRVTLEDFQATLSNAEYDFITNGVKPSIPARLKSQVPTTPVNAEPSKKATQPKKVSSFGKTIVAKRQAPAINMERPTIKEADKYKFRTTGKSVILFDDPLPIGIVYKIRIGVFTKDPAEAQLKNLSPITTEKRGTAKRYYAGLFHTYDEAIKALGEVKKKGFKDAVIDAWVNGRVEQTAKARAAEKRTQQTTSKSSATKKSSAGKPSTSYRIAVTVSPTTSANVPAILNSLSGGRDITKKTNSNGTITYSMGLYPKLDEVNNIKDQLVGKGLTNVEVQTVELNN